MCHSGKGGRGRMLTAAETEATLRSRVDVATSPGNLDFIPYLSRYIVDFEEYADNMNAPVGISVAIRCHNDEVEWPWIGPQVRYPPTHSSAPQVPV
jgi:hypothetical protein